MRRLPKKVIYTGQTNDGISGSCLPATFPDTDPDGRYACELIEENSDDDCSARPGRGRVDGTTCKIDQQIDPPDQPGWFIDGDTDDCGPEVRFSDGSEPAVGSMLTLTCEDDFGGVLQACP